MQGKIEIICDDKGVHISVQVKVKRESDPVFLTHAVGRALGLSPEDYLIMSLAEAEGVLDGKGSPSSITIDRKELLKQLEEEQLESGCI